VQPPAQHAGPWRAPMHSMCRRSHSRSATYSSQRLQQLLSYQQRLPAEQSRVKQCWGAAVPAEHSSGCQQSIAGSSNVGGWHQRCWGASKGAACAYVRPGVRSGWFHAHSWHPALPSWRWQSVPSYASCQARID